MYPANVWLYKQTSSRVVLAYTAVEVKSPSWQQISTAIHNGEKWWPLCYDDFR